MPDVRTCPHLSAICPPNIHQLRETPRGQSCPHLSAPVCTCPLNVRQIRETPRNQDCPDLSAPVCTCCRTLVSLLDQYQKGEKNNYFIISWYFFQRYQKLKDDSLQIFKMIPCRSVVCAVCRTSTLSECTNAELPTSTRESQDTLRSRG